MATVHASLGALFALLLDPLQSLDPRASLVLVSVAIGVFLIYAFRGTSNPTAIRAAREKAEAHLLAVRLYRHDPAVVLRSQGSFLLALGRYLGRMAIPFLWLLAPFGLLFAHLDARYARRALHPGERAIVTANVSRGGAGSWSLEPSAGIAVEAGPVRIADRGELSWRVRAVEAGDLAVTLVNGGRRVEKAVRVATRTTGASPHRGRPSVASLLRAPSEPTIDPAAGVERVEVGYPPLRLSMAGWKLHWIVVFLVASIVPALLLKRRAGVEF